MSDIEIGRAGEYFIGSVLLADEEEDTVRSVIKMYLPEDHIQRDGTVHRKHPKWDEYVVTPVEEYCIIALIWETFLIGLANTTTPWISLWYDQLAFGDPFYSAIIKGED